MYQENTARLQQTGLRNDLEPLRSAEVSCMMLFQSPTDRFQESTINSFRPRRPSRLGNSFQPRLWTIIMPCSNETFPLLQDEVGQVGCKACPASTNTLGLGRLAKDVQGIKLHVFTNSAGLCCRATMKRSCHAYQLAPIQLS